MLMFYNAIKKRAKKINLLTIKAPGVKISSYTRRCQKMTTQIHHFQADIKSFKAAINGLG